LDDILLAHSVNAMLTSNGKPLEKHMARKDLPSAPSAACPELPAALWLLDGLKPLQNRPIA
jgi:hypothetical protein